MQIIIIEEIKIRITSKLRSRFKSNMPQICYWIVFYVHIPLNLPCQNYSLWNCTTYHLHWVLFSIYFVFPPPSSMINIATCACFLWRIANCSYAILKRWIRRKEDSQRNTQTMSNRRIKMSSTVYILMKSESSCLMTRQLNHHRKLYE